MFSLEVESSFDSALVLACMLDLVSVLVSALYLDSQCFSDWVLASVLS